MIFSFGKPSKEKLKELALKDYERAVEISQEKSRISKQHCLRTALRCRTNIDKLFVEAAKKAQIHEVEILDAIKHGRRIPEQPKAGCYQLVKVADGYMYTYIPEKYAELIFQIGWWYQTEKISKEAAIERTQVIADAICDELGVLQRFSILQFLKDGPEDEEDLGPITSSDSE
ncbi:MAG: hypothetical protein ACO280_02760 [Pseudohongiellaceae bacterium]|jgi:hypothetical protein